MLFDLLAALLLSVVLQGLYAPSSDNLNTLPYIMKMGDNALFQSDFAFGQGLNAYYKFSHTVMYLLSCVCEPIVGFAILNLVAQTILFIALRRLASQITGLRVPAIVFPLLGLLSAHFIAGYRLTAARFSHHHISLALVFLSLALFFDRHIIRMVLAVCVAILFNPRIGCFGCAAIFAAWLWITNRKHRFYALMLAIPAGIVLVCFLEWQFAQPRGGLSWDQIVLIWVYARCPWHFVPAAWKEPYIANLALGTLLFVLVVFRAKCLRYHDSSVEANRSLQCVTARVAPAIAFVSLACIALMCGGLLNSGFEVFPSLILVNPFQLGPIVVGAYAVLVAAICICRLHRGYWFSSLLVFSCPSLPVQMAAIIVVLILDDAIITKRFATVFEKDVFVSLVQITILIPALTVFGNFTLEAPFSLWYLKIMICIFVPPAVLFLVHSRFKHVTLVWLFLFALAFSRVTTAYGTHTLAGVDLNAWDSETDWTQVCRYAKENTPIDSCFIIPPDKHHCDFQYRSQRSALVSFIHLPQSIALVPEWMRRLKRLHFFDRSLDENSMSAIPIMTPEDYSELDADEIMALSRDYPFADYCILPSSAALDLEVVFENLTYSVYQIPSGSTN